MEKIQGSLKPYIYIYIYTHIYIHTYIHTYIHICICITSPQHRASIRILHRTLFLAWGLISIQVFLTVLASSSTALRHVFLGLPCPVHLGGSTQGLAWQYRRTVFAVYVETKVITRKTEEKMDGKYKEGHQRNTPK